MKKKVIQFFQNLPQEEYEQFNDAFQLYRDSPGKNHGVERQLNASGYSKRGLENLLYDLQKMHGITDLEKVNGVVASFLSDGKTMTFIDKDSDLAKKISNDLAGDGTGTALPEVVTNLENEIEDLKSEKEDLEFEKEELEVENEELKTENEALKALPLITAKSVRVEFPFLNEKDCPDEFKILVADKITAWNNYVDAQNSLSQAQELNDLSLEQLADLAKISVDSFAENQKIYEELNCYQTTGKILGVHPVFKRLALTREVEAMTAEEMINYKGATAKYFSVNKTALAKAEKAKDLVKAEEIKNRVAERSEKLFLVNKKLGVKNK